MSEIYIKYETYTIYNRSGEYYNETVKEKKGSPRLSGGGFSLLFRRETGVFLRNGLDTVRAYRRKGRRAGSCLDFFNLYPQILLFFH